MVSCAPAGAAAKAATIASVDSHVDFILEPFSAALLLSASSGFALVSPPRGGDAGPLVPDFRVPRHAAPSLKSGTYALMLYPFRCSLAEIVRPFCREILRLLVDSSCGPFNFNIKRFF